MMEITHAGLWFNWSSLDRPSKLLAGASLSCAVGAALPFGVGLGMTTRSMFYRLGYWVGSGGQSAPLVAEQPASIAPWLAWLALALMAASALLWWRFSVRQDELFNRIQNWALGMGGAWTAAVLTGWAVLALAGVVAPVAPLPLIVMFWVAVVGFWFAAVRRWA